MRKAGSPSPQTGIYGRMKFSGEVVFVKPPPEMFLGQVDLAGLLTLVPTRKRRHTFVKAALIIKGKSWLSYFRSYFRSVQAPTPRLAEAIFFRQALLGPIRASEK